MKLLLEFFQNIYRYREYMKQSIARDLRKQYKRSSLGYVWSMLNPLMMMLILSVVFSSIMKQRAEDYAVFLFCGMIPWSYFGSTVNGSLGTLRANAKIMDQVAVPKYIFPLSVGFSNLANFFLSIVPLIMVMLIVGSEFHWTILLLPIVLLPLFCATMGISLLLSVSNIFFEDTKHLTEVALRALYFLSPILYHRDQLPDWLIKYVVFNPMFYLIEFMRGLIYYGEIPNWGVYSLHLGGTMLLLVFGLWVFKKVEHKFIYFM